MRRTPSDTTPQRDGAPQRAGAKAPRSGPSCSGTLRGASSTALTGARSADLVDLVDRAAEGSFTRTECATLMLQLTTWLLRCLIGAFVVGPTLGQGFYNSSKRAAGQEQQARSSKSSRSRGAVQCRLLYRGPHGGGAARTHVVGLSVRWWPAATAARRGCVILVASRCHFGAWIQMRLMCASVVPHEGHAYRSSAGAQARVKRTGEGEQPCGLPAGAQVAAPTGRRVGLAAAHPWCSRCRRGWVRSKRARRSTGRPRRSTSKSQSRTSCSARGGRMVHQAREACPLVRRTVCTRHAAVARPSPQHTHCHHHHRVHALEGRHALVAAGADDVRWRRQVGGLDHRHHGGRLVDGHALRWEHARWRRAGHGDARRALVIIHARRRRRVLGALARRDRWVAGLQRALRRRRVVISRLRLLLLLLLLIIRVVADERRRRSGILRASAQDVQRDASR